MDIKKIIIICGIARSGTTWLQFWMLSHPEIFGQYNESGAFYDVVHRISQPTYYLEPWVDRTFYLRLSGKYLYDLFSNMPGKNNRPYLLEKAPRNLQYVREINEMMSPLSEAYFLHIYRDGRNVVESGKRNRNNPAGHALSWIKGMSKMLSGGFPENTLHIKYEDLASSPESSRRISQFCGIEHISDIKPFDPDYSPPNEWAVRPVNTIPHFDPDRWKKIKDPDLQQSFRDMKPMLELLGYEV